MNDMTQIFLLSGVFLFLGVFASKISSVLQVPILIVFLAIGMLAGSDGLGGIHYEDVTQANFIGSMALAFILFSGGYDTRWSSVRKVLLPGTMLASVGVLLTAVILGVCVSRMLGMPLEWGLLFGAVISSTDAAATFAIFQSKNFGLKGNLRPILEYESGSNDPMAAFLTLFMIDKIAHPELSYATILPLFLLRISVGVGMGVLVARLMTFLFDRLHLEYDGLYYVLGVGTVFCAFSLAELCHGNGFMAVYVCGLVMGNSRFVSKYGLGRFHDGLAWLMQVAIFLTLGLLVFPKKLPEVAWDGLGIALLLMFVVRPLVVLICLPGKRFTWREKTLISWGGLRGAAPIVLATFPLMAKVEESQRLFDLVFFVVLLSILIQGKTLTPLAARLKLNREEPPRPRSPLEFEETGHTNEQLSEFRLTAESPHLGKTVAELNLPSGVLILLVGRKDRYLIPSGAMRLESGDVLHTFYDPEQHPDLEALLLGSD